MYTLEVWRFAPGQAEAVASFSMVESGTSRGLFSIGQSSKVRVSEGLSVEVTAERVPTGEIHLSATHGDETGLFMSAWGPVTIRVHPSEGPPYVVKLRKSDA